MEHGVWSGSGGRPPAAAAAGGGGGLGLGARSCFCFYLLLATRGLVSMQCPLLGLGAPHGPQAGRSGGAKCWPLATEG
jgi:hypothetical protein